MRIVFAGTPGFAAIALDALVAAGHEVALVLTQPDRPAGRGMKLVASEVKQRALALGLPVAQPATLKDSAAVDLLRATGARTMVVAAYGLLLPKVVLEAFPLGCINIHGSLLPRWRGAAPIHRAILAGDSETGVCIMQMEAGLDTGPVLRRAAIPIGPDDTTGSVHDRLAVLGGALVVETITALETTPATPEPQPEDGVTYAQKIRREDAIVDWTVPAVVVDRVVRAFDPAPGALTTLRGDNVKLWRARPLPTTSTGAAGEIVAADADGIVVRCGDGTHLVVTELQRAGGKRLPARDFLQGFPVTPGERFAPPAA